MHGPDQIIPRVASGKIGDPRFAARQPIALEPRAVSAASRRRGRPRPVDPRKVFRQIGQRHPPIVERFGKRLRMVGYPIFRKVCRDRGVHEFLRRTFGMVAQRRVGMIVGGHGSGDSG